MSELELSLFRQRSHEALKQKARRGELFLGVAAGYVKAGRVRIEKDADQRVQEALMLVFAKFAEFQSVRQVHIWLREEGIVLPVKSHNTEGRAIIWKLPAYNTVHNILTNPIYAGVYAFGRTTSKVSVVVGRKRMRRGLRRRVTEWDVLLKEQHEGYITWDEFEKNQRVIANNANSKGSATVKGAVRRGELLLAGLLRCGHCGRKLHVTYSGKVGRYNCHGARTNHGTERCISIGGRGTDAAVSAEVLRILRPLGIDAAVKALTAQVGEISAAHRQLALALQRPVIFDPNLRLHRWRSHADAAATANACVPGALLVRCNEHEAMVMTGEEDPERAALALTKAGARMAVVTLGARGAILRGELRADARGLPVEVLSTIGAGDVLSGFLLARLALAGFYPPAVAAALPEAVAAAASACQRWGALE